MNQQVSDFIQTARERGLSDEVIKGELLKKGWTEAALAAYFMRRGGLGFFSVLAETLTLIATRLGPIFLVWFITSLVTLACILAIGFSAFMMFMSLADRSSNSVWLYFFLAVLSAVPLAFSLPWGQAALIAITSRRLGLSVGGALRRGWQFTVKNSILNLLMFVSVLGNLFFLFVPGVVVATWIAFASYALVVDGLGVRGALAYSRSLLTGRFWRVLLILIIYLLVNSGLSFTFSKLTEWAALTFWTGLLFSVLLSFLLASFGVIFLQVFYEDLRVGVAFPIVAKPRLSLYVWTGMAGFLAVLATPILFGAFFWGEKYLIK